MEGIKISGLIGPSFYDVHRAIKAGSHTYFLLKGGRGSCKSSTISIEIILGIMKNPGTHGVALRKIGLHLADSVFSQLIWAIDKLGVTNYWKVQKSPLELIYRPTGQRILFRGADDPQKSKSIKVSSGYIRYVWYEELDQFAGEDEIGEFNRSFVRGGERFAVFYSYNPPKSKNNWVNIWSIEQESNPALYTHHSSYLTVPPSWLGDPFIRDAEEMQLKKPEKYKHVYMGAVTGTGGAVFDNLEIRTISDEELSRFEYLYRGLDFGYTIDPTCYIVLAYEKATETLYACYEVYQPRMSNRAIADAIKVENPGRKLVIADSAEPKSIDELKLYGINIQGAKKGPDSVDYGIKWLQDRAKIIIDRKRCPNAAREYDNYEYERDRWGNFISAFPDKNNHTIDPSRYAMEKEMSRRKVHFYTQ